jgi:hypothetical protein
MAEQSNQLSAGIGSKNSSSAEDALIAWGELKFREDSLGRDAEEREWQEEALFYQRRQWLEWKEGERRFIQIKPDKRKPRPMPVSNYFAKAVNANANQLGSELVRVVATAKHDDPKTRRAADYAEMAKDAVDVESNLRLLNPLLAKHTALWGMGVTKETIDTTEDQQPLDEQEMESTSVTGCLDCGQVTPGEATDGTDDDTFSQQQVPCPECGSQNTTQWTQNNATTVSQYVTGKGKIKTEVRPIFEIYLPRDVQNPNLSPRIIQRYRRPLSACRRTWGDKASDIKSDDPATNTSETRFDVLRTLTAYSYAEKINAETVMLTEVWAKWDQLPKKLQEIVESSFEQVDEEDEDQDNDSAINADDTPELIQMKQYGLFFIYAQGVMLQWGPNEIVDPDDEECYFPYTFFLWDIDPASVYPKGCGSDLLPLQKRLNRLDSLIELSMMTNAAGKWLWPSTQNNKKPPTGDPSDVAEYDPIGDGKLKPEFVQPSPTHGQVWTYRASIVQDFQELGLTLGVQTGDAGDQAAFRTVAYLGAKASEQLNTQRYLWESAHCLRYKKCLVLAKLYWDEERQVKIAGPNGQFSFQTFTGDELRGMYEIEFVKNSSIPKTLDEKMQMLQTMIAAGLVDITDPTVREYIYELTNMTGVNLAGELQYRKSERDLETIKRGEMPVESPYQDWNIELKTMANFTLTEEFEALDPQLQAYVMAFAEYCNQKVTMIAQQTAMQAAQMSMAAASQPGGNSPGKADPNNKTLAKIPGVTAAPQAAESAATSQGDQFAQSMGA